MLDVGCGYGGQLHVALENHQFDKIVGWTLSENQVKQGGRLLSEFDSSRYEINEGDYREDKRVFNHITSTGMVSHVGPRGLLPYVREIKSRIRSGGRYIHHAIMQPYLDKPLNHHIGPLLNKTYVWPGFHWFTIGEHLKTLESNGFRIVSEHMPGLASASVGLWVTAGARNERAEQNGIAHFLEHMAFKGTERRNALQIAEAIEDVGGYINAYTSREVTAYYARVLEADVPLAVDVLADILLNPVFDPQEIETERGVILQEIGQALDTPDDVIFDWLQEQAYPEQAMGRTILNMANDYPEKQITVLCGHTHNSGICEPAANVRVITGAAEYGWPSITQTFELP